MSSSKSIQQLDLNLLKIFECLYVEQNMTLAAKTLFITPSAVSHAIKRLRLVLNDPLFIRQGQLMKPTPACKRMAPQLINHLNRIRQILQQCGQFDPQHTQQIFKIAIHEALESQIIPLLINRVSHLIPNAQLVSVALSRDLIVRQLASGEIDIAIDVARAISTSISHQKLLSDPFCVVADSTTFNVKDNVLTAAAYMNAGHVVVSSRPAGKVIEDIQLQQQGLNRLVKYRCQTYQTAAKIIKGSNLLLTVPRSLAEQFTESHLTIYPLPINIGEIETHQYWHKNTENDAAMEWLRGHIQQLTLTQQG